VFIAKRGFVSTWGRRGLFVLLILRLALTRVALVRTVHDLAPHRDIEPIEAILLRAFERHCALRIVLTELTPTPPGAPRVVIPHGHYRDWYARYPQPEAQPGRLTYAGLIDEYKGIDLLIPAFRELDDPRLRLFIGGYPLRADIGHQVESLARDDSRIDLHLGFLEDAEFVRVLCEAQLVVLPYRVMHNSGALLAALSLGRRALVPTAPINDEIAGEVGDEWVLRYEGEFTADTLRDAIAATTGPATVAHPDLRRRNWSAVGAAHLAAFHEAIRMRRHLN
jgi:glycosyltransferase involved in cell wall biosynthesis